MIRTALAYTAAAILIVWAVHVVQTATAKARWDVQWAEQLREMNR